jgi:hypothetical protein
MLATRVKGHHRGSPRYSYNAGSAGLVDGAGYPWCIWGVGFWCYRTEVRASSCCRRLDHPKRRARRPADFGDSTKKRGLDKSAQNGSDCEKLW